MRDADTTARAFMAAQHGLLTVDQAHGIGLDRFALAHRVDRGEWRWCTPRVLASVAAPVTRQQELLLAVLDAGGGSGLSHTTALSHWGVRGFVDDPIHIVRHRERLDHKVAGAVLHEVRYLPWDLVRTLDGIPVVSPALALLQLAGMPSIHTGRLARAIDAAWVDRLVTYSTLSAVADRMSRQGRRGLTRYRELVEERGPGYVPPASNLEARLQELVQRAGLPPLRRQVDCGSDARWIGRVDFRATDCPLAIEVQSERFHRGLLAERDDRLRIERLSAAGLTVVEVVEEDVYHRPDRALEQILRGRAVARRSAA
jgi:hypothetical protein